MNLLKFQLMTRHFSSSFVVHNESGAGCSLVDGTDIYRRLHCTCESCAPAVIQMSCNSYSMPRHSYCSQFSKGPNDVPHQPATKQRNCGISSLRFEAPMFSITHVVYTCNQFFKPGYSSCCSQLLTQLSFFFSCIR